MAIWQMKLVDYNLATPYTANLTVEDKGNGLAVGTLRHLTGPVPTPEIDLSGVVSGNQFTLGGSVHALGIHLFLTFSPFIFSFTGSARLAIHDGNKVVELFVLTRASE
jgi:hypothetical protein